MPCASHLTSGQPLRLLLEHLDEEPADDLALALRVLFAFERREEALRGVDADHADAEVRREGLHDLVALAEPQQAVVDEHAGELVADRAVQERRDDGGIDAAGQAEQHAVAADLLAHARDGVVDDVAGIPERVAAADVAHEPLEDRRARRACASLRDGTARRRSAARRPPSPRAARSPWRRSR